MNTECTTDTSGVYSARTCKQVSCTSNCVSWGCAGTSLATVQPKTVILSLFKIAARVKQYKDLVLLHLPSACPVKSLLAQLCHKLYPANKMRVMAASP